MPKITMRLTTLLFVCTLLLVATHPAAAQEPASLERCKEFAYSTEEDFVTQGPTPADGTTRA